LTSVYSMLKQRLDDVKFKQEFRGKLQKAEDEARKSKEEKERLK